MKYLILFFALLSTFSFAQDICVISGDYKLKYKKVVHEETYKSQDSAIKAAKAANVICGCQVGVIQPVLTVDVCPVKSSSSKASSKSSSSSVSSVASSVQASSSVPVLTDTSTSSGPPSSSSGSISSVAPKSSYIQGKCPIARVNGESLPLNQIGGYDLNCDGRHETFKSDSCDINYITSLPQLTKVCEIAAFDTTGLKSDYVLVER